jgi:hypothetical protein
MSHLPRTLVLFGHRSHPTLSLASKADLHRREGKRKERREGGRKGEKQTGFMQISHLIISGRRYDWSHFTDPKK